jgi:hypothetical protein
MKSRALILATALAATAALPATASATPDGCAANPECLISVVHGAPAPVQPAAEYPATAQKAVKNRNGRKRARAHRRRHAAKRPRG